MTPYLLDYLAARPRHRLLEVGSGGGLASMAAAGQVGPDGLVVGADISAPLVRLATERAEAAGVTNTRFVEADVQVASIGGAPFDAAFSQFGVMFFEDPVAAFANIREQVRPGGRLVFACWLAATENPWHIAPALAPYIPPAEAPDPASASSAHPTGPFVLADHEHTGGLLAGAGWTLIERVEIREEVEVELETLTSDDQMAFMGVAPERLDEARTAVDAHLGPLRREGSAGYRAPLALQIFVAGR